MVCYEVECLADCFIHKGSSFFYRIVQCLKGWISRRCYPGVFIFERTREVKKNAGVCAIFDYEPNTARMLCNGMIDSPKHIALNMQPTIFSFAVIFMSLSPF